MNTNKDGWEWEEDDNDIDHIEFAFEPPQYAHLTIHLPISRYVCNMKHPLDTHIKVASFWPISRMDVVLLYLMLGQQAVVRIYGERPRATLLLMMRCLDWDDGIDVQDSDGLSTNNGTVLLRSCSSSVANDASVYNSPNNTKKFDLPIYASATQDDDDNNDTHHPKYNDRINCLVKLGASEYGESFFDTTNFKTIITYHNLFATLASNESDNNYEHYTSSVGVRAYP